MAHHDTQLITRSFFRQNFPRLVDLGNKKNLKGQLPPKKHLEKTQNQRFIPNVFPNPSGPCSYHNHTRRQIVRWSHKLRFHDFASELAQVFSQRKQEKNGGTTMVSVSVSYVVYKMYIMWPLDIGTKTGLECQTAGWFMSATHYHELFSAV